jgi:hypothetical protein
MWKLTPLFFLLSSCVFGPGNFRSSHSSDLAMRKIKRIAILVPELPIPEEKGKAAYLSNPPSALKGPENEANLLLSHFLHSTMSALPNWQIVSDREVKQVGTMLGQGSDGARARKLGELVYADAVISGRVVRYRERVGEELGVKSPASVTFVLELWDVRRGDIIWSARFDETQKPLSENIFAIGEFAQRGAKWLTAEELMHEGVKKAVSQLQKALYGT